MVELELNFETREENNAYIEGVKHGIWMYARWKDGEQVVGIMEQPLKEINARLEMLRQ